MAAARWNPQRRPGQLFSGWIGSALLSLALLAVLALGFKRPSKPPLDPSSLEMRIVREPAPHARNVAARAPRSLAPRPQTSSRTAPAEPVETPELAPGGSINAAQTPLPSASDPALDLKITSAMLASARGLGTETREDLARLHTNDPRSRLERGVEWSALPDCMSGDALKHAPDLGPYLKLNGLARLPLVVATVATGKCKLP